MTSPITIPAYGADWNGLVFGPIVADAPVCFIHSCATVCRIKPAPRVKRFVIGSNSRMDS